MVSIIFHKEWMEFKRDKRIYWAVFILYLLFVISLVTGIRYYNHTVAGSTKAAEQSYRQWLSQGKKNPHSAAHYGFYAYKPLSPLAIIDKGMEGYLGQAVWLEAHNQNEVKEREAADAGSIVRFGNLTTGFVFQFLVPLVIVLVGFTIVSKEKEYGTLPLLLSSVTCMWPVFKGKLLALYSLVLAIFLPLLISAWAGIFFTAGATAFTSIVPHLLLLTACYLLYIGIWVCLSVYLSSKAKQSAVALTALLGFWIIGVFFIPRMSGFAAKRLHAAPSSFTFSNNIRLDNELGVDRKTPAILRQKQFEDSLLSVYNVDSLSQLPLSMRGLNLQKGEEYGYLVFEKNYGGLEQTYRKQDAVMRWLYLLSPAQSMHSISSGVSGTDMNKHIDFAEQAELHRRLIAKTMNEDIAKNSVGKEVYEVSNHFWATIPAFKYRDKSISGLVKLQWLGLVSLVTWLLLLLLLVRLKAKQFSLT